MAQKWEQTIVRDTAGQDIMGTSQQVIQRAASHVSVCGDIGNTGVWLFTQTSPEDLDLFEVLIGVDFVKVYFARTPAVFGLCV